MSARKRGAGRPGALDEARALVTLVSSLSEAGDSLDPAAVAERLGVSLDQAEKLVSLVLSSTLLGDVGLPLIEEGGAVTLMDERGVRGRRLRLSRDETLALVAALERMGVPEDDPLRRQLEEAESCEKIDERLVRQLMAGEEGDGELARTLDSIGRALARGLGLSFAYQKPGSAPERRRVVCLGLRHDDDAWFLDAYDLDRCGERTFRADRISDAACGERESVPPERGRDEGRVVTITFADPSYLELLPWHDLRVTRREDGVVEAETPYFGGEWLARMVAACSGTAVVRDDELAALVRSYARRTLEDE